MSVTDFASLDVSLRWLFPIDQGLTGKALFPPPPFSLSRDHDSGSLGLPGIIRVRRVTPVVSVGDSESPSAAGPRPRRLL